MAPTRVLAVAPGRVNLIGDHTDYTGGLVLPMAIDRATTVEGERGGDRVVLASSDEADPADVALDVADAAQVEPPWARYVAGVVAVVKPETGLAGRVRSSVPVGAGLSSSAALEVAVALALGASGSPRQLAVALQRAEHLATGVKTGIMDQLASLSGVENHALLIDCASLDVTPVAVPDGLDFVVTDSGVQRGLAGTAYAERRRQCEAAAAEIGPLRSASLADVETLRDPVLRRRARHVVTENARVTAFAAALESGDLTAAGELATESHISLRDDFEVSTPELDALVDSMTATAGVLGARLTGAGFGGCVLTLCHPGTTVQGWRVRPAAGATVEVD